METFISLNKYKTSQNVKKVPTASCDYLVSKLLPLKIMSNPDIRDPDIGAIFSQIRACVT